MVTRILINVNLFTEVMQLPTKIVNILLFLYVPVSFYIFPCIIWHSIRPYLVTISNTLTESCSKSYCFFFGSLCTKLSKKGFCDLFLIKSSYYIVPSPSTALLICIFSSFYLWFISYNRSNTSHGISEEIATAVFSITPNPIVNEINENANPANAATSLTTAGLNWV